VEARAGEVVFVNGLVATLGTAPVSGSVANFGRLHVRAGDFGGIGVMGGGRFVVDSSFGFGGVFSRSVVGGHGLWARNRPARVLSHAGTFIPVESVPRGRFASTYW
jgi:hypothetical protein